MNPAFPEVGGRIIECHHPISSKDTCTPFIIQDIRPGSHGRNEYTIEFDDGVYWCDLVGLTRMESGTFFCIKIVRKELILPPVEILPTQPTSVTEEEFQELISLLQNKSVTMTFPKVSGKTEFIAAYQAVVYKRLMNALYGEGQSIVPFPSTFRGETHQASCDYLEFLNKNWIAERRCFLEDNSYYRHAIAYGVVATNVDNEWKVFVYQRTSKTGEGRLAGKHSIGIGGHVEASDVFRDGCQDDLLLAISACFTREANEEFRFHTVVHDGLNGPYSEKRIPIHLSDDVKPQLIINSDEGVDLYHLGFVPIYILNDHISSVASCEEDQIAIGFRTLSEIREEGIYDNLESWSKKIVEKTFSILESR